MKKIRETHDQLIVYVPKDDLNKFREYTKQNDTKMSQVIRKYIKELING